jgi:uncharacterized membrane protein YqaE (UPF0057 family)
MAQRASLMNPTIALPKNRKRTRVGLFFLSFFAPPLAVYLDGGSAATVLLSVLLCYLGFLPAILHALFYVMRSRKRRMMSRPMRYRLWTFHSPVVARQVAESVPKTVARGEKTSAPDVFSQAPLNLQNLQTNKNPHALSAIPEQPSSASVKEKRPQAPSIRSSSSSFYMTKTSLDGDPFRDPAHGM